MNTFWLFENEKERKEETIRNPFGLCYQPCHILSFVDFTVFKSCQALDFQRPSKFGVWTKTPRRKNVVSIIKQNRLMKIRSNGIFIFVLDKYLKYLIKKKILLILLLIMIEGRDSRNLNHHIIRCLPYLFKY